MQVVLYFCAMATQKRRSDCPISFALEIFGDRWTFLIIRDLMFKGKRYFGEFLQSEEKIATNILASRLSLLEDAGILSKYADPAHGSKRIYLLTKKGMDLVPLLVEFILWSAKYDPETAVDWSFVEQAKRNKAGLIEGIQQKLLTESNSFHEEK